MKIKQISRKWIPLFALTVLLLVTLACATSSNEVAPAIDPGVVQTAIIDTVVAVQLQTLTAGTPNNVPLPTTNLEQTNTPLPAITIAPTETLIPTLEPTALPTLIDSSLIRIKTVDKEAEYVDLENIGNQLQDLAGWSLVSEKGNQACSLGGVIMPGTTLRVWSNNPNVEGYNCNYGSEIWNNSELDPAVLYNNQGQEVARYP